MTRDELIIACEPRVAHLASKYARYGCAWIDREDFISVGMLGVFEASERALQVKFPLAYACRAAEIKMCLMLRSRDDELTLSLDRPLTNEGDCTLLDIVAKRDLASHTQDAPISRPLANALDKLSDKVRRAVLLKYGLLDGVAHSAQEIAEIERVPYGTAQSRVGYGLQKLYSIMAKQRVPM